MPQPIAVAPVAADLTTLDYIKALSGFAIPATALLVLVGLIFLVVAVAFRWFEVNASWGKLVLKVQRPPKAVASPSQPAPSVVQGTAEEAPKAAIDQEIPGQAERRP